MVMLKTPDPRTQLALKQLRGDPDFTQILAWLEESVHDLDRAKRSTMDGVLLRMQQGAARAVAEIVDHANGNTPATTSTRRPTSAEGRPRALEP